MFIDKELELSDSQAVTSSAASTNYIDLSVDADVGVGKPLWVIMQLDVAADAGNSDETYSVALQTDDNTSFSSATDIATTTITRGDAAGTGYTMGFPMANERYIRLYYTTAGTSPSMTISSWVTDQLPTKWAAYADAI